MLFTKQFSLIFKHGLVSCGSGLIEYVIFLLLLYIINLNLFQAHIAAFSSATIFGFFAHSFFTFKIKAYRINAIFFLIQALLVLTIGYAILNLFIGFELKPELAKFLQLICTFGINVFFSKYITFKIRH
jgi:putative flippase GtrA